TQTLLVRACRQSRRVFERLVDGGRACLNACVVGAEHRNAIDRLAEPETLVQSVLVEGLHVRNLRSRYERGVEQLTGPRVVAKFASEGATTLDVERVRAFELETWIFEQIGVDACGKLGAHALRETLDQH